jgi:hypothetical protein
MINAIVGVLAFLLFISVFIFDNFALKVFMVIACALTVYSCAESSYLKNEREVNDREGREEQSRCAIPKLQTTIDGVTLYKYRECCGCSDIYFSIKGTIREKCVSTGKTTRDCFNIYVPNTHEINQ